MDIVLLDSRIMPDMQGYDDALLSYTVGVVTNGTQNLMLQEGAYAVINWDDRKYSTVIPTQSFNGSVYVATITGKHDYDLVNGSKNFERGPYNVHVALHNPGDKIYHADFELGVDEGQHFVIPNDVKVSESENFATITITLDKAATRTISLNYETVEDKFANPSTYAWSSIDYVHTTGRLVFTPGATSRTFKIPIIDEKTDDRAEEEPVIIRLSKPINASRDNSLHFPYPREPETVTFPYDEFRVWIQDDDDAQIGFVKELYLASENAEHAVIGLALPVNSEKTITFTYATTLPPFFHSSPEATPGDDTDPPDDSWDYIDPPNTPNNTIVLPPFATSTYFEIGILDNDKDSEGDIEYTGLTLGDMENVSWWSGHDEADLGILDDEYDWGDLVDLDLSAIDPFHDESELPEPCSCECSCNAGGEIGPQPVTGAGHMHDEGDASLHHGTGDLEYFVPLEPNGANDSRRLTTSTGSVGFADPLILVHSSQSTAANPAVAARLTVNSGSEVSRRIRAKVTYNNVAGSETVIELDGLQAQGSAAIALRGPDAVTTSGIYEWSLQIKASLDDDGGEYVFNLDDQRQGVVRFSNSPFGPGWNLLTLDQLFEDKTTGDILYVTGNGEDFIFESKGGGSYETPDHLFGTLSLVSGAYIFSSLEQTKRYFSSAGRLQRIVDRHGLTITYAYDKNNQLTNILDPDGRVTTITYDQGLAKTITTVGNRITTFAYDGSGNLNTLKLPDGGTRTFSYDGQLLKTERWGTRATTFTYEGGMLASVDQGLGTITKIKTAIFPGLMREMDGTLPMAIITDPLNHLTTFSMNDEGQRLRMKTPDGGAHNWTINESGLPLTYKDPLNRTTTYTYISDTDRINTITRPDQSVVTYSYDGTYHQLTKYEDSLGHVTTYHLNATGDVDYTIDPANYRTTLTWDTGSATITKVTNPLNNSITYQYDANRRLVKSIDGEGSVTTYLYDAAWNADRIIDPLNRTTTYVFDKMRRLTAMTTPDKATSNYEYAAPGWRTKFTNPLGTDTVYHYDVRGWTNAVTENDGGSLQRTTTYEYDVAARLVRTTDPYEQLVDYKYDPVGRPLEIMDELGNVTTQTFDLANNLLTITDSLAHTTTFTYHKTRDWLETTKDAFNNVTSYAYDKEGNLLTMTDPTNVVTSYGYDVLDRVTKIQEAFGKSEVRTTQFAYDGVGNLLSMTDNFGFVTSYAYNKREQISKTIEAFGTMTYERNTQFAYDQAGQLLYSTDANGTVTSFAYDGAGRVARIIEAYGLSLQRTTTIDYDLAGRQTKITDPLGTVTSYGYDALNRLTKLTEAYGLTSPLLERSTTFAYDLLDRLIGSTDPLQSKSVIIYDPLSRPIYDARGINSALATTSSDPFTLPIINEYQYDALGHVTLHTLPNGSLTSMSYDALGRPNKITEAFGTGVERTTTFSYDAVGRLKNMTDPLGTVTSYGYDALSRITKVTKAYGVSGVERSTQFAYGTAANTIAVTNPRGHVGTLAYDPLGRLATQSDGLGHATTFKYDALDRLTNQTDALGRTATFTYDALSRNTRIDQPESVYTTFAYDAVDRMTQRTNALNQTTSFAYDALGRQTRMTDGRGYHTTMEYDAVDRLTKLVDPNGNQTTYGYDALGRLLRRTDALLNVSTYAYDAGSRLISTRDRAAARRDFQYDELDRRVLEERFAVNGDLVETLTFSYDLNHNVTGAANKTGTYTITYTQLNQPKVVNEPFSLTLTFTYDAAGNRTLVEDSKSGLVSSSYDAANRLTRREMYTSSTLRLAMDYAYTNADQMLSETRRNGSNTQVGRTTYAYDNAGRNTLLKHQDGSNSDFQTLTYTYDAANRVTALIRNNTTTSYEYDAADQLTKDGSITFAYDKAGNPTINTTIGTGNQLIQYKTSKTNYTVYEYDDNGNRIEREYTQEPRDGGDKTVTTSKHYAYDHAQRMIFVEDYGTSNNLNWRVDYELDAFGNRISKLYRNGSLTTLSYEKFGIDMWEVQQDFWGNRLKPIGNEAANVWVDLNGLSSDALTMRRMYGPGWDNVEARLDGSNTARWYLNDRLGSVIGAVDGSGSPVATITYQAFGTTSGGILIDRYGFQGREYDSLIGTYYMRDRIYDPERGRFLQEDPLELASGDYNWYRFVGNSPTNATDPSGLDPTVWLYHLVTDSTGNYLQITAPNNPAVQKYYLRGKTIDQLLRDLKSINPDIQFRPLINDCRIEKPENQPRALRSFLAQPDKKPAGPTAEEMRQFNNRLAGLGSIIVGGLGMAGSASAAFSTGGGAAGMGYFGFLASWDLILAGLGQLVAGEQTETLVSQFFQTQEIDPATANAINQGIIVVGGLTPAGAPLLPGVRPPNVALGLETIDGQAALSTFAQQHKALTSRQWAGAKLTTNVPLERFDVAFQQALDNTINSGGRIKFNLDSLPIQKALAGDPTCRVARYTEWELQQIVRNNAWLGKTDFYLKGRQLTEVERGRLGLTFHGN